MQVIVCDIDGTLVDVTQRIASCLREIGVDPGDEPQAAFEKLVRPNRGQFFKHFLSNKYVSLDTPVPEVVEAVRALQASTGLSLVVLSGRPVLLKRATVAILAEAGIEYHELLLRSRADSMKRTGRFKIDSLRVRGYEPLHILDDDAEILTALGEAFPVATLYRVKGSQTTPWPG